jgi:hypothetical protein
MPFNGSGLFQRVRNWVADAAAGVKIRADYHDAEDDGFAAGLSNCITKDGQTVVTQNIPMNSKRITGLADPVNPQDAATKASVGTQIVSVSVPLTGGTMTGPLVLAGDPVNPLDAATKQYVDAHDALTQAAAIAAAKTAGDIAYQVKDPQLFAGIPINNQTVNYTPALTDAQKAIVMKAAGTITIPADATVNFPIQTCITFICWHGGVTTLAAAAGVNAYINLNGVVASFPRTVSNVGMVTALKVEANTWFCTGSGVT